MKRKIKIQPINIPHQDSPIVIEMNDTDLFYLKAKKGVADILKGINQDEFVFYSKSKSLVVHEEDRVSKIFLNKDSNEIDLYLTSDLIKKAVSVGGGVAGGGQFYQAAQQIMGQQQNKEAKLENEIKDLKSEVLKLENQLRIEKNDLNNQISEYQDQIQELQNEQKSLKKWFDDKVQQEEEQRAEIIQKYKDMMVVNNNLRNEIMQKENLIEELQYQLKTAEVEKKFNEDQYKRENEQGRQQSTMLNDTEFQKARFEVENLNRLYKEEQFERKKEKEVASQLQKQIQEQKNKLQQKCEELNQARSYAEQEIANLKEDIKRLEEKCSQYKDQIIQQKKDITDQTNKYMQIQIKLSEVEAELSLQIKNVNKLRDDVKEQQQEIERKDNIIRDIKSSKDAQLNKMNKSEEEKQDKIHALENEVKKITEDRRRIKDQLQDENQQKTIEIHKLQKELQNLIETSNQNMQTANQKIEKLLNQLEKENEKLKVEENKRAQLAKRIKENALRKVGDGKIVSPTEALFKNMSNPFEFLKNENIMTNDWTVQVEILRIDTNKALESLIKSQEPNIAQFVQREPIGNWTIKKSLGINGDGTKRKAFLMQVISSEGDRYTHQVFLVKELIGFERIVTVEKALYVAQSSLIAKVLADLFQDKIQKSVPEKPPCKFAYREPFLLQAAEGNFYIAERLTKGNFTKFNGEGESIDKDQKTTSYLNAFSLFTYFATQKMLMVSNIQGNYDGAEYILCDPVISSPEGIMGDEDLAEPHILQFQDNFKENPKNYGKNYLNSLGFKI
ncbi:unnamed protein product [Paramecium sonneborni]|uniref:Alpha-type protein kinase domain-containing protein n=1 Tax=Paramecium sonneborni TaxID=65129 RepID=A0A8S1NXK8_9CILI|nr:unnamed protein product [Paramecium sonneborni]